ncbi:MAG: LytTR family DNA-binding domain-containing protein [Rikenellaceae bacterium]|nr:LytTR family DNA-binding domain-containing protein [Rikenellaceae bacterium]
MKCIAVDDEPLALSIIEGFCNKIGYLELTGKCPNAIEAAELIKEQEVDLIFLDINMPHLTGIDLVKMSPSLPMVIFTTAYADYALTGYDLDIVDYLLKPFSFDRFFKAVSKAKELYDLKNLPKSYKFLLPQPTADGGADYLMIRVEYSTVRLNIADILYVEGLKDYVKIATLSKNYVTKSSMKNVEEKLPSGRFIRIHKSFIVNLDKVEAFENNHILIGGGKLPLGSNYRDIFMEFIEKNRL